MEGEREAGSSGSANKGAPPSASNLLWLCAVERIFQTCRMPLPVLACVCVSGLPWLRDIPGIWVRVPVHCSLHCPPASIKTGCTINMPPCASQVFQHSTSIQRFRAWDITKLQSCSGLRSEAQSRDDSKRRHVRFCFWSQGNH